MKLKLLREWSHERSVLYMQENDVDTSRKLIEKIPSVLNQNIARNMEFAFRSTGKMKPGM